MYYAFVWLLHDFNENQFFSGNKRRIELGTVIDIGQAEGITLQHDMKGYMSGEAIVLPNYSINEPAKVHAIDFSAYIKPNTMHTNSFSSLKSLRITPNPTQNTLQLSETVNQSLTYRIINVNGNFVLTGTLPPHTTFIAIDSLTSGHYKLIIADEMHFSFIKD